MNAPRQLSQHTVQSALEGALRRHWPTSGGETVAKVAASARYLTGGVPARVALAIHVVESTGQGVAAGAWPDAEDLDVAGDLLAGALDYVLDAPRNPLELAAFTRVLRTGRPVAVGLPT